MKQIRNILFYQLLCFSILSFCPPSLFAQEHPVSIHIDKKSLRFGGHCIFTVMAKSSDVIKPTIPSNENFIVEYLGKEESSTSRFQIVINGREFKSNQGSGTTKYRYKVTPKKTGVLSFPSIDISVSGNKVMRTNPFNIEVLEKADHSRNIFFQIATDKEQAYLGQEILVDFKFYFNQDIQGIEWHIPWLSSLKNFIIRDPELDKNKRYQRVIINGSDEIYADRASEVINGQEYAVIQFKKILIPLTPGEYDLTDSFLKCDVVVGYEQRQGRSLFDDFFSSDFDSFFGIGRRAVTESYVARGPSLQLTIKEVPKENQPENYSEGIGQFQFEVDVSSRSVKTGDPVTLQMQIFGNGNLEQIKMPSVSELEGFRGYDPESKLIKKRIGGKEVLVKTFEKVLIPTLPGVYEIPATSFVYFNTKTGSYATITKGPFSITVEKGEEEEQQIHYIAIDESAGAQEKELKIVKQDIQFIKTSLGPTQKKKRPIYKNILVLLPLFGLPLFVAIFSYFYAKEHNRLNSDAVYRKEQQAYKIAVQELERFDKQGHSDYYFEIMRILNNYLSAKLNLPSGGMTADVADHLLDCGIKKDLTDHIRTLYDKTDQLKYAGGAVLDASEKEKVFQEIKNIISEINRELK